MLDSGVLSTGLGGTEMSQAIASIMFVIIAIYALVACPLWAGLLAVALAILNVFMFVEDWRKKRQVR
jgi:hypothetical protein